MPICSEGRVRMIPRSSIDGKASYHGRCKCIAPRLADRRGGRARMLPSGRDQRREALQASLGKMRSRFGREGG